MRSGGGCLQTYLLICASDRKQFVTVFVRAYALSAMIIPARVFAVGPDLPLILPHLFNRIRAFLELQLSTRLRRHRSKCKRDEVHDTEKGRRSDPGRIEQNALTLRTTAILMGNSTASVNFLGLEVFLAPPTAWAARNQPRTPEN